MLKSASPRRNSGPSELPGGLRQALGAHCLGAGDLLPELVGEPGDNFVLHIEEIGDRLVEAFGPEVHAGVGLDQLHVDAHAVSAALHAAFEHVAHVEIASNLSEIGRFAFVGKGGTAADDDNRSDMLERRRPVMDEWAALLAGEAEPAKVVSIGSRQKPGPG